MIYKHFSNAACINNIFISQELYMPKLTECKGQDEFSLTIVMFNDMLDRIDFSKIDYKKALTKEKFMKMCSIKLEIDDLKAYDYLYGACITANGNNEIFTKKYGKDYVSFNLEAIKKKNSGFLFIYKVVYDLNNIEQYLYDLALLLYNRGEYETRYALHLSENDMRDDYKYMIQRLYHFLKILYKPSEYSFEDETRIIVDKRIIDSGLIEKFVGDNYHYSHHILKNTCKEYLDYDGKKYILKLYAFPNISILKKENNNI